MANLFKGPSADTKYQAYFHDNEALLEFRQLPIENTCLIYEKDEKHQAFIHTFKGEYYFPGFGNMKPGSITPGYSRDVVLQFHPIYKDDELPTAKNGRYNQGYLQSVATNRAALIATTAEIKGQSDKIINTLIILACGLGVIFGLVAALR